MQGFLSGGVRKAESIENQFLICREFAKVTDDIEIIGCYSDFWQEWHEL